MGVGGAGEGEEEGGEGWKGVGRAGGEGGDTLHAGRVVHGEVDDEQLGGAHVVARGGRVRPARLLDGQLGAGHHVLDLRRNLRDGEGCV